MISILYLIGFGLCIVVLFIGAPFGMFCLLRRFQSSWKLSVQTWLLVVACILLTGFCYYRYETATGILARYNVFFNPDAVAFESPNLNTVRFWYDGPQGKLDGPEIMGDLLYLEKPHQTPDGKIEVVVRSQVHHKHFVRIQLITPPTKGIAFQVMPGYDNYNVFYPPQGIRGGP